MSGNLKVAEKHKCFGWKSLMVENLFLHGSCQIKWEI